MRKREKRPSLTVLFAAALVAALPVAAQEVSAPADVAGPPPDAERTDSGLATKVLSPGTGETHPGPRDHVVVHYSGWTTDGELFDSSVARGEPVRLPLDRVIDGWTEGMQLMVEGEKRRLWIPEELAYDGQEGKPQGMLVFDVELLEIVPFPDPPENVAAPPEDAIAHEDGLYSKVLKEGLGTEHPEPTSLVTVHYSGWTTDGQLFDSSLLRGEPATFNLGQVIEGWVQGVQLMVPGEKRRLWIPEELAYQGQEGRPAGMLVFDIELLAIAGTQETSQ